MILCDAGPLVALVHKGGPHHRTCARALKRIHGPLLTTWACFTEAMYLLGRIGHWRYQSELWLYRPRGLVEFHHITQDAEDRVIQLMEQYRDLPMDLADATLVATAEATGLRRVFTLDSDFRIYRTADGGSFEIVP